MMMGMPKKDNRMMMNSDDNEDIDSGKGGKLLALQDLLDAISQMSDDEIRPDIERLKNEIHMDHESAEGDDLGVQEAEEHEDMMNKDPGMGIEIGVKGSPDTTDESENEDEEDESGMPKGGFLAILSKKMQKKSS